MMGNSRYKKDIKDIPVPADVRLVKKGKIKLPVKVGLVFLENESSKLDFDQFAASYFILQLNKVQNLFEFSVIRDEEKQVSKIPHSDNAEDFLSWLINFSETISDRLDFWIGITSKSFSGNYFFITYGGGYSLITTSDWKKEYALPSLFEYLTHAAIVCSVYSLDYTKKELLKSHGPTMGCIFDFTRDKRDRKITVASEFICHDCRKRIVQSLGQKALVEIEKMVSKDWMGLTEDPDTPSHNLKKFYRYDIERNSGFSKTKSEKLLDTILYDISPDIFKTVVGAILLSVVAFLLGSYL
jgi:hypothetical protein